MADINKTENKKTVAIAKDSGQSLTYTFKKTDCENNKSIFEILKLNTGSSKEDKPE